RLQHLQRDDAVHVLLPRLEHRPHRARADPREDLVVREGLREGHGAASSASSPPTPYLSSLRCSAKRETPSISAVRLLLPPDSRSAFSISRTSSSRTRSGSVVPRSAGVGPASSVAGSRTASLRCSTVITPPPRIAARRTSFCSSRTLPGQRYATSFAIASGVTRD